MTAITLDTIRAGALRENGYPNFGAGGSGDLGQHTTITGHLTRETRPGYRQALPADSHLLEGRANHLIRAPNHGTDFRCIKVRHGQAEYRRYLSRFQGSHSDAGGRQIMNQAPNRGVLVHGDQPVFVHVAAGFGSALEKAIHVRVLCHEPLALMQLNILNTISRGFSVSPLDETLRVTFGSNPWRSTKPVRIAPRAVEQPKPARPVEIVRFLRPADLQVVS